MSSIQPSRFSKQFTSLEITGVQLTEKILGKGSDATVKEVNWVGTSCAAKQLHEVLLQDHSPGGVKRFVDNFEKECMTWSKLIHPHIVQFLGVYYLSESRIPMLILEKMDTSLRNYLEKHTKENFVLPDKIYVLRQVAQALSYLHSRSPPLVHHDLSTNNILVNEVSLQAKVTDFGMTRAMDPSKMSRKSSVKGTLAFMSPEALVDPPKYDEKLDVFSYGNVVITMVTHFWPTPQQPTRLKGKKLIAVSELERRQQYLVLFTPKENELFLPIVRPCLQNDPTMRPTSIQLVTQMRGIEESHPRRVEDSTVIPQLRKDLQLKDEQLHEKDQQLREKQKEINFLCKDQEALRKDQGRRHQENEQLCRHLRVLQDEVDRLRSKDQQLRENHELMQKILEESGQQWEEIKELQTERGQHIQGIATLRKDQEALRKDRDWHLQEVKRLHRHNHVLQEEVDRLRSKSSPVIQVGIGWVSCLCVATSHPKYMLLCIMCTCM